MPLSDTWARVILEDSLSTAYYKYPAIPLSFKFSLTAKKGSFISCIFYPRCFETLINAQFINRIQSGVIYNIFIRINRFSIVGF